MAERSDFPQKSGDPLNLMRLKPPKGAKNLNAMRTPLRMAFFFL
jgi:hypothetical protein